MAKLTRQTMRKAPAFVADAHFRTFSDSSRGEGHSAGVISNRTIANALKRCLRVAGALLLAMLVAGGPVLAQGRGHAYGRDDGPYQRGYPAGGQGAQGRGHAYGRDDGPYQRGYPAGGPPGRWARQPPPGWRGPDRGDVPYGYGPPRAYGPPPGYGPYMGVPLYPQRPIPPGMGLRRGGVIPPGHGGVVVPDYGRYRLRPPPPGFAWVRMGDRYMLVSRATGQIFDIIGE
jgi:hypothetical protein